MRSERGLTPPGCRGERVEGVRGKHGRVGARRDADDVARRQSRASRRDRSHLATAGSGVSPGRREGVAGCAAHARRGRRSRPPGGSRRCPARAARRPRRAAPGRRERPAAKGPTSRTCPACTATGCQVEQHLTVEARRQVGARQGHDRRGQEAQRRADERHLEAGGGLGVADQQVADAERDRVGRATRRHAQVGEAGSSEVLHCGEQPRTQHLDHRSTRMPWQRGRVGRDLVRPVDRHETHVVSKLQPGRGLAVGVEEAQRGAADQAPPSGGGLGVDAGLGAADRHRAGRYPWARRGEARRCELRRQAAEVREARREPQEVHEVVGSAVAAHDLGRGQVAVGRDIGQVWPGLAAVADRDVDPPTRRQWRVRSAAQGRLDAGGKSPAVVCRGSKLTSSVA